MVFLADALQTLLKQQPEIALENKSQCTTLIDYVVLYGIKSNDKIPCGYFYPLLETLLNHDDLF